MGKIGKESHKNIYTPFEMSTIMERLIALNRDVHSRDYGTGEKFTSVEVHFLSYIVDHPGISAASIAYDWNRTKGAVSQIIKKMEKKELIFREKMKDNDKTICLYPTEKGKKLDCAHREYDTRNYVNFNEILNRYFSEDEIQLAFAVMEKWTELSMDWVPM